MKHALDPFEDCTGNLDVKRVRPASEPDPAARLMSFYRRRVESDLGLMDAIVEAERLGVPEKEGFESAADWVVARLGIGYTSALNLVRVATCLEELPSMKAAYRAGALTYDHLRALVLVTGPDNEADMLLMAEGMSVGDTWRMVNKIIEVSRQDSLYKRNNRFLKMRWDLESRVMFMWGMFPEEMGAMVERSIDAIARQMPDDHLDSDVDAKGNLVEYPTAMDAKRADALCSLAGSFLSENPAQAQVVIHVDAEVLAGSGNAEIEDGPVISSETARRLWCDSVIRVVAESADGRPVGIGRSSRRIPERIRRELKKRDVRCRFRGCRRRKGLHAHHIRSWSDGGPTDYDNLILLCPTHHVLVHEGGWQMRGRHPHVWFEPPMPVGARAP